MIETPNAFTEVWFAHHGFLLDIAYRLLGSYSEAEDMVQEAFTRLLRADLDPIEDVRAWLVVVVSRLCLDHLRSARVRREAHVGPWFPEPLLGGTALSADPAHLVTLDESVRLALLIVLERLSPAERVVFVLHDVFSFPFERVAAMVGRSPAACRQLASRARRRVRDEADPARFATDPEQRRQVIDAFIAACAGGDIEALLPLLDPAVAGWADLGELAVGVSQPLVGREIVAQRVMQFFGAASGTTLLAREVNGEPAIVAVRGGRVFAVLVLTLTDGTITRLYSVVDPAKLSQVQRALDPEG